jgi:leader peptidase (prepilin peptidase)/N-methyltransferase
MPTFEPEVWGKVPFHFWSVVMFVFGSMVGSFLNVCIHRMPLDQSVISPPSHCPHCKYSIPWFLNIPLVTWLMLRGKCGNCGAPIAVRYFLVELLTGVAFLICWLAFGRESAPLALAYSVMMAGFIVATFIDFEHLIIPDEITLGGAVVGFILSFAVPLLHNTTNRGEAMKASLFGIAIAAGSVYLVLRGGKLLFGKERIKLDPDSRLIFTETHLKLPDEREIPYGDMLYRDNDMIRFHAKTIELPEICYFNKVVELTPKQLTIGEDKFVPEEVKHMEVVTSEIVLPREAMGLGDVKFMAAIGAFHGFPASLFTFFASACIGSVVGLALMLLRRQDKSGRIPYGPFLTLAAIIWIFLPDAAQTYWVNYLRMFKQIFTGGGPPAI